MARLPQPGSDKNVWGNVLNDFLAQSHNTDGTLKDAIVSRSKLAADATSSLAKADTALQAVDIAGKANTSSLATVATSGSYTDLTSKPTIPAAYTDEQAQDAAASLLTTGTVSGISFVYDDANNKINTTVTPGAIADATTTTKGAVQLAGDLAGTAAAPTVAKVNGVTLPGSAPTVGQVLTATGTAATTWSTPATAPVLSVAGRGGTITLGEGDIANLTTDLAAKAADTAVVHLAGTETITGNKTFSGTVAVPTPSTPTSATTKSYVDSVASSGAPDATTTVKGIIQLAGDLAGTAASPTVPGLAAKATDSLVVHLAGTETVSGNKTFSGTVAVPTATTGTNTTQVASTAFVTTAVAAVSGGGSAYLTATSQTGTTYSFALADANTVVEGNNVAAQIFTVLQSSSVAWVTGTVIEVYQLGAGQISIAAGTNVTLQNPSSLNVRAQYGTVSLRYRGSNVWAVSGDLA